MPKTLKQLLSDLETGRISALQHAEATLAKARDCTELNAFITIDEGAFLESARQSDLCRRSGQAGLLEGAALAIKDNIDTQDLRTTAGTPGLTGHAAADAPPLRRLRDAGALVAGKTNLHELAFGITSNNAAFGPVRNPADPLLIAGGSSGGTAAAVAAGIVPAGLGTDTGGSVRIPAALCGIAGFRPSVGRYPAGGVASLSSTRDTIGPMAHDVADIALLDGLMADEGIQSLSRREAGSLRLGIPRRVLWEGLEPLVATRCEAALDLLRSAGVTLVETDPEDIWADDSAASFPIVLYEAKRELRAYVEKRGVSYEDLLSRVASPDVRGILQSLDGPGDIPIAAYRAAMDLHRPAMNRKWHSWLEENRLDGALFPTCALTARPIGRDETVALNGSDLPTFPTYIRNTDHGSVMGIPGISLPVPGTGLPVGLEIDGSFRKDRALLSVAAAVENILQG
jgi:Asp-tRNA(Asn)/Glu-tRNA(Gln) amidotransferase A subunit family amidase